MFRHVILILIVICAFAYAGIQPLKMDNTSLIEHNNKKHLVKREALLWWKKIVDFLVNFFQQSVFHLGMFGMNYKNFSDSMKNVFKEILGIKY